MANDKVASTAAPTLSQILDEMAAAKAILSGIQNLLGPAPEPDTLSDDVNDRIERILKSLRDVTDLGLLLERLEEKYDGDEEYEVGCAFRACANYVASLADDLDDQVEALRKALSAGDRP